VQRSARIVLRDFEPVLLVLFGQLYLDFCVYEVPPCGNFSYYNLPSVLFADAIQKSGSAYANWLTAFFVAR
jgi:hypothetical protein